MADELEPVVSAEAARGLELMDVYTSKVEAKRASDLLKVLVAAGDQRHLHHLKRIRQSTCGDGNERELSVILCTADVPFEEQSSALRSIAVAFELKPTIARVPRHGPVTKDQYAAWRVHWPLSFTPPPPRRPMATEDVALLREHMLHAIREAVQCRVSEGAPAVAAMIVAPDFRSRLAVISSPIAPAPGQGAWSRNPLQHAVMRAIEEVGVHNHERQRDRPGVRTAASPRQSFPTGNYLASGCIAVMTCEPCAMCAMALLHSRIKCAVYAVEDPANGALGSAFRLHTERGLNHHFEVYRGLLREEARFAKVAPACLLADDRGHADAASNAACESAPACVHAAAPHGMPPIATTGGGGRSPVR